LDTALVLALAARVLGSDSSNPGVVPGVDLDGVESKTGVELDPGVSGLNERRGKFRRAIDLLLQIARNAVPAHAVYSIRVDSALPPVTSGDMPNRLSHKVRTPR
jgi:hypothetical protein